MGAAFLYDGALLRKLIFYNPFEIASSLIVLNIKVTIRKYHYQNFTFHKSFIQSKERLNTI